MPDPINIAANVAVLGFGPAGVSAAAALVETGCSGDHVQCGATHPHSHGECRPRRTPVGSQADRA
jgi:flavin-dependent dehydrogenase